MADYPEGEPSPEEIREGTRLIREEWPVDEDGRFLRDRPQPYETRVMKDPQVR